MVGASAANSIFSGSAVSAPGAGAPVCSVTIPTGGIYEIEVNIMLTGTAETNLNNGRLRVGDVTNQLIPTLTGVPFRFRIARAYIPDNSQVAFSAGAAATAGAVYAAYICATRVD